MKITSTIIFVLIIAFHSTGQNVYPIHKGDKYGLMDEYGNIVLTPQFEMIGDCSNNRCLVFTNTGMQKSIGSLKAGYIDYKGNIVIPIEYNFAMPFTENKAFVFNEGIYYCIDTLGTVLFQLEKDYIPSFFSEGIATIKKSSWHEGDTLFTKAINTEGEIIFSIQSETLFLYENGYATIIRYDEKIPDKQKFFEGEHILIDMTGKIVQELPNNCIGIVGEGLFSFADGDKYGFMNLKNEIIIPAIYSFKKPIDVGKFKNGLCRIKKGDKWGCIDKEGNIVIDFNYDCIDFFDGKVFSVCVGDKRSYINIKGEILYVNE